VLRHRLPDVREDDRSLAIIPIVQDLGESVRVTTGWDRFEEVPANEFTSLSYTGCRNMLPGSFDDLWLIKQDTANLPLTGENSG
jgi:hypothetical protein